MHSVFATNTKYNFLNYKIPLIYMTKKARFFTQNTLDGSGKLRYNTIVTEYRQFETILS